MVEKLDNKVSGERFLYMEDKFFNNSKEREEDRNNSSPKLCKSTHTHTENNI